jgi:hypothetical protein
MVERLGSHFAAAGTLMACLVAPVMADTVSISARLNQEYAAAADLRAFAMHAKARPSEGGMFYARYAVDICGRDFALIQRLGAAAMAKEIRATGTVASYRMTLGASIVNRCAAFVPGEADTLFRELAATPASHDPLVAADKEMVAAFHSRNPDLIRAAVAGLIAIDDPLLWTHHSLFALLAQSDPEARNESGVFFGGVVYTAEPDGKLLEANSALELAFCRPGTACAKLDDLRLMCAGGGACAPDLETRQKNFYMANGGTADRWKLVLALTQQIRDALASKNVVFFVR